jgi:hypothetical protein
MHTDRIPEIIDEQDVARLFERQTEILDLAGFDAGVCDHPGAQLHCSGVAMATAIATYLRSCHGQLDDLGNGSSRHARHLLTLIDFADQFRAHHLDYLDRLNPA